MGSYGTDKPFIVYRGIYVLKLFLPGDVLHMLKIVVFIEINKVWDSCVSDVYILFHLILYLSVRDFHY